MIALWRGELPLARAFWEYAFLYGLLASTACTAAAFAAISAGLPDALAVALHLLPVPYLIAAAVGVWRSAANYAGPPHWASNARVASVIWTLLMIIA